MTYEERVLKMLGDPAKADAELKEFRRSARLLSSRRKDLVARYAQKWVGVHDGRVVAHGATIDEVVAGLEQQGVPRGRAIVRFISKSPRKMIL